MSFSNSHMYRAANRQRINEQPKEEAAHLREQNESSLNNQECNGQRSDSQRSIYEGSSNTVESSRNLTFVPKFASYIRNEKSSDASPSCAFNQSTSSTQFENFFAINQKKLAKNQMDSSMRLRKFEFTNSSHSSDCGKHPAANESSKHMDSSICKKEINEITSEETKRNAENLLNNYLVQEKGGDSNLIQKTLNGCENFNVISFGVIFKKDIPKKLPAVEPYSLLETFYLKIFLDRHALKDSFKDSLQASSEEKAFLDAVQKFYEQKSSPGQSLNFTLNALVALFKAEISVERRSPRTPQFQAEGNRAESVLPGRELTEQKPMKLITFIAKTKPASNEGVNEESEYVEK